MFFLLWRRTDDGIFDNFPKISDHFLKIPTDFLKARQTFLKIFRKFPKLSEDCWGRFEEDPKMFWSYTKEFKYNLRDKLDISEIIDIFTSEAVENMPLQSRM